MNADGLTFAAALVAGLVGSSHCIAMCGGIALAFGAQSRRRPLSSALLYNSGRITSYAIAGALAGGLGVGLGQLLDPQVLIVVLRALAGAMLVAIGLQIALNWRLLRPIENLGFRLWHRVSPAARSLIGRRGALPALLLGGLWGWLPCGLVYSILVAATFSGGSLQGAGLMLAFGLGTAPALIATGTAASRLQRLTRRPAFRRTGGAFVVVLGLLTALMPWLMHHAPAGGYLNMLGLCGPGETLL